MVDLRVAVNLRQATVKQALDYSRMLLVWKAIDSNPNWVLQMDSLNPV